jgi:outer membrane lipoprotein-sorting protein
MKRVLSTWILPIALIVVSAGSAFAQTLDDVIEKHIAAIGGRDALGKLTSRHSTGTVTVATPAGDLSGPFESFAKKPNKTRAHMTIDASAVGGGSVEIDQRFDGTSGTILNSMTGDTDMPASQADNLRNQLFPTILLTYKEAGVKAELQPREDVSGKKAFVLLFTPKSGSPVRMFLDPDTYLLMKTITSITTPEMGTLEQTSQLSDYRTVDGVKVPFQIANSNAAQSITIKLTKVEHNVPIDDAMFKR